MITQKTVIDYDYPMSAGKNHGYRLEIKKCHPVAL